MASVGTIKYRNGFSWVDILHPVGSFYFSTSSSSPATLFGGTWTQITGAAIRGNTSTGYIGSDTHVLTVSEMPAHTHQRGNGSWIAYWGNNENEVAAQTFSGGGYTFRSNQNYNDNWLTGQSTGGSAAHSIVQRSYNCYIWYRTA